MNPLFSCNLAIFETVFSAFFCIFASTLVVANERERRKIGDTDAVFPYGLCQLARTVTENHLTCAEVMGTICLDNHSPNELLYPAAESGQRIAGIIKLLKQAAFPFHDLKNPIIIANDASQIHRDNGLSFIRDRRFQLVIIHLRHMGDGIAVFLNIHKRYCNSAMNGDLGRSSVCISGNDHLIARTNTLYAQVQFFGSRCTIHVDNTVGIPLKKKVIINSNKPHIFSPKPVLAFWVCHISLKPVPSS